MAEGAVWNRTRSEASSYPSSTLPYLYSNIAIAFSTSATLQSRVQLARRIIPRQAQSRRNLDFPTNPFRSCLSVIAKAKMTAAFHKIINPSNASSASCCQIQHGVTVTSGRLLSLVQADRKGNHPLKDPCSFAGLRSGEGMEYITILG